MDMKYDIKNAEKDLNCLGIATRTANNKFKNEKDIINNLKEKWETLKNEDVIKWNISNKLVGIRLVAKFMYEMEKHNNDI